MQKIIFPILTILLFMVSCQQLETPIKDVYALPDDIDESSAVEIPLRSKLTWTLQDSGNNAELYAMDSQGEIAHTLSISDVKNNDWEDLSSDETGNLYIGDFGNNDNDRKNLSIYKVNAADLTKPNTNVAATIKFYYPEQQEFPPKKAGRIFDAESFFYFNGQFYIFTKNRSSKFDGTTQLYRIPNKEGNHAATLISLFKTCGNYKTCAVTSADISPDGKKVVLLNADKVWIFEGFTGDNFFSGKSTQIDLHHNSQKEGICFVGNNVLYITDEKDKKTGGKLYELRLKD